MTDALRAGDVIADKLRVVSQLGAGGYGVVYEARHVALERRFAVKLLKPELEKRASALARFEREARSAAAIEHENIAAVTDFGTTAAGEPFLVMEFLEGVDLARLLAREHRLPPERAVDLVVQACRGVSAAHARGIVHRDLKPSNLFVTRRADGSDLVKVLDFGVAKLLEPGADEATTEGVTGSDSTLGTPHYMSPEQARGSRELDARTDVYALGAILYEALSGQKAHPGDSPHRVLYHVITCEPEPLSELRPELDSALVGIVERALAREPGERWPSVAELAEALRPGAIPARAIRRESLDGTATLTSPDSAPAPARSAPRRRAGIALAAVVLAVAAVWAFVAVRRMHVTPADDVASASAARAASTAAQRELSSAGSTPTPTTAAPAADALTRSGASTGRPPMTRPAPRSPISAGPAPTGAPRIDRKNPYR